jgi:hypothetical protein
MMFVTLAFVASLAAANPTPSPPAPAQPVEEPKGLDKVECRREVETGTRVVRKRICATKRVWDQVREEHLDSTAHRKVDAERSRPCTGIPCRP